MSSTFNTGWIFPGVAVDTGGGNSAWGAPENVRAWDGAYASFADAAFTTTNNLDTSAYGSPLPAGAQITGIAARITHYHSNPGASHGANTSDTTSDYRVQLMKAGAPVGNNYATGAAWGVGNVVTWTYGGDGNLWGTTWKKSDINSAAFGLRYQGYVGGVGNASANYIDQISLMIYFEVVQGSGFFAVF